MMRKVDLIQDVPGSEPHSQGTCLLSLCMPAHAIGQDEEAHGQRRLSVLREHELHGQAGILIAFADAPRIGGQTHLQVVGKLRWARF